MWNRLLLLAQLVLCGKILVLYERPDVKVTHSKFFATLASTQDDLIFKSADDQSLEVIKYGVNIYRSVVIMAPSIDDFGGKVNPATLLEFVDNGGTIFAATDTTVGEVSPRARS